MASTIKAFLISAAILLSINAQAQDVGQTIMDNAAATQYNYMTSHIAGLSLKNVAGKGKSTGKVGHGLTYNPSPKIKSKVIDNLALQMKLDAATTAKLKQTNIDAAFTSITAPYNLKYNDASDIVAAYQVLNWMIANRSPNPQPASVAAVRETSDNALRQNKQIYSDAGKRAMIGEELKALFVIQHAGWQNAIKKGTEKNFSDIIATQYKN